MTLPKPLLTENPANAEGWITGGTVNGLGLTVFWQRGPLEVPTVTDDDGNVVPATDSDGNTIPPRANGAYVEDVIEAARQRLEAFQQGPGACPEAQDALEHLEKALVALTNRTVDREVRGVDNTYES